MYLNICGIMNLISIMNLKRLKLSSKDDHKAYKIKLSDIYLLLNI